MQTPFLSLVAHDLHQKHGEELSDFVLVFPNRRAGLFLNEHLYEEFQKPFRAPSYMTISELVKNVSTYTIADELELLYRLYLIYQKHASKNDEEQPDKHQETFEQFYHWGKILLADFEDIDKNLADASALFRNLETYKEYENTFDFLNEDQKEILSRFFESVNTKNPSKINQTFRKTWNILGAVYTDFVAELKASNQAYEGMIYRQVVHQLETEKDFSCFPKKKYIFIGFNVLNISEKTLFLQLQQEGKALFYWDYDLYYVQDEKQEAGAFMRENLQIFPSQLSDPSLFSNLNNQDKDIHILSATGKTMQTQYLAPWLKKIGETSSEKPLKETAIVLGDEELLQSTIHALPSRIGNRDTQVNITMGFPFRQTPLFSLICLWMEYQIHGVHAKKTKLKFLKPLLKHPYIEAIESETSTCLTRLYKTNRFSPSLSDINLPSLDPFLEESADSRICLSRMLKMILRIAKVKPQDSETLFRGYTAIQRIYDFMEKQSLEISKSLTQTLVKTILQSIIVPFEGSPLGGIQVMGVLETRNLNFENLIILSTNEGCLPNISNDNTCIPYSLKQAYNLSTIERNTAVFAYYFFRLIQRAQHITFVYDSSSTGLYRGEMSRFLQQLRLESNLNISYGNLSASTSLPSHIDIHMNADDAFHNKLKEIFFSPEKTRLLSPSAINSFLNCPFQFHLKYLANIRPKNEEPDTTINSLTSGNIFHCAAELLYQNIFNNDLSIPWDNSQSYLVTKEHLEPYRNNAERIDHLIHCAFNLVFFDPLKGEPIDTPREYNTMQKINKKVLSEYLSRLIQKDYEHAPFHLISMEQEVKATIPIYIETEEFSLNIGGRVDRIDLKDGVLRIIDYKTGGSPKKVKELKDLFLSDNNRNSYALQILLYAWMIQSSPKNISTPFQHIQTDIWYIHQLPSETSLDTLSIQNTPMISFSPFHDPFEELLKEYLHTLFSPSQSWSQCIDTELCTYCNYTPICQR